MHYLMQETTNNILLPVAIACYMKRLLAVGNGPPHATVISMFPVIASLRLYVYRYGVEHSQEHFHNIFAKKIWWKRRQCR